MAVNHLRIAIFTYMAILGLFDFSEKSDSGCPAKVFFHYNTPLNAGLRLKFWMPKIPKKYIRFHNNVFLTDGHIWEDLKT